MEKKIMIVDDAMFMRHLIRKNLEEAGYCNIIEAADGETALMLFRQESPDLTILDITMPGISGLEVLDTMKTEKPDTVVIMCSAVGQEALILEAVSKGAADFIVKPFKGEEFKKIIKYNLS